MIKVCDAFMGAGKTSAAINHMRTHKGRKFIYITPYNDETERIRDACPDLHFWIPNKFKAEYDHAKRNHLKALLQEGKNVSITHALFKLCDSETVDIIREQGYEIIIDEAVDVFNKMEISDDDFALIMASGWFQVEDDGDSKIYTYDIEAAPHKYRQGRFADLFIYASSQRITELSSEKHGSGFFYWTLSESLFCGDNDVTILTFMFKGSMMASFLEANMIDFEYIGVKRKPGTGPAGEPLFEFVDTPQCPPDYVGSLSTLINICDNPKLNKIGDRINALSSSWFDSRIGDNQSDIKTLKNNTYYFFRYVCGDYKSSQRLWSTFSKAETKVKNNGYRDAFLSFTTKATNAYRECCALAYLVNIYNNPSIKIYLSNRGAAFNDDDYALSIMVQWIWRSAIRDGKPIHLYLPSRRMRTLLKKWIEESENTYRRMKAAEAAE